MKDSWEFLGHGVSSDVYFDGDDTVKKVYREFEAGLHEFYGYLDSKECFLHEVSLLQALKGTRHFPQLKGWDEHTKTIFMSYCGPTFRQGVTHSLTPENVQRQLDEIADELVRSGVHYKKPSKKGKNACVLNNVIYCIDFNSSRYESDHAALVAQSELVRAALAEILAKAYLPE